MHNERLLERVEKELDTIADKGLTTSNIDLAYKLIDIYKDIKESKYYECETKNDGSSYNGRYWDGRYSGSWEARGGSDNRYDRYFTRMREGID